jgi:molybdopterin molybdotransferase
MIKVDEARSVILENTRTLQSETIDILSSLNRITAEDIYSAQVIPPFNNSAMDGYAVISSELQGASKESPIILRVSGSIAAGHNSKIMVEDGTALKIMTGAPLPQGADAVVPIEYTEVNRNLVKIYKQAANWENIRFAGEDVKMGQLVIPNGKKLRPAEIGMLAALNIMNISVRKIPKVSILATGDELVDLGEELTPGKIRNINGYSLYAEALKYSCEPVSLGIAGDNMSELKDKLELGRQSDILVISGGVSVGDFDYAKKVLVEMGMEEKFWRVAVKPGKPVLFGLLGNTLVFGLPGNPVSSVVAFEQFVLPAIYKMQGRKRKPWTELNAILHGSIKKDAGLTHFIRGKTFLTDGRIHVKTTGSQSSGVFSSMVAADCLIIVPENVTEIKNGEEVLIQITDEIGE